MNLCIKQTLMKEMESREVQFNSVQDAGEELVMKAHPASKMIEVCRKLVTA